MHLPNDSATLLLGIYLREMKNLHKNVYVKVYNSFIYSPLKLKKIQMSFSWLMGKQVV